MSCMYLSTETVRIVESGKSFDELDLVIIEHTLGRSYALGLIMDLGQWDPLSITLVVPGVIYRVTRSM